MTGSDTYEASKHLYNSLDTSPIRIKAKEKVKDLKLKTRIKNSLNNTNVEIADQENHLATLGNEREEVMSTDGKVQTQR